MKKRKVRTKTIGGAGVTATTKLVSDRKTLIPGHLMVSWLIAIGELSSVNQKIFEAGVALSYARARATASGKIRKKIGECKLCNVSLVETSSGKQGRGPLTQLRCPKCQIFYYINRPPKPKRTKKK